MVGEGGLSRYGGNKCKYYKEIKWKSDDNYLWKSTKQAIICNCKGVRGLQFLPYNFSEYCPPDGKHSVFLLYLLYSVF